MRTDLTAAFLAEMDKDENEPIQLLVIHFPDIGDVYLSDRDIIIEGITYNGIVENWGDLSTVGAENAISSTMTMTVTIWNGGNQPFSAYFRNEDPVDVFVEIFQTYAGLDPEDIACIGEFTIQDPIEFAEADSLLDLELVTTNMRYFAQIGKLLTKDDFLDALESDINKPIDLIIGNAGRVKCLCCKKPPIAAIDRSVVRNTENIEVRDNLNDKNFPQYGTFTINGESVYYTSRGDYVFNNCQRGHNNTQAVDHSTGSVIILATTVQYLVGLALPDPIIPSDILVNGKPSLQDHIVIGDIKGATVIQFESQPVYEDLAPAKQNTVYFDTTEELNTADQPFYAYSDNYRAEGAFLNYVNNKKILHISNLKDAITEQGVGDIVNVFLNITHWATKAFASKSVYVSLKCSGVWHNVGWLAAPNDNADLNLVADVNIDHPHVHETTGSSHDHYSQDQIDSLLQDGHIHPTPVTKLWKDNGDPFSYYPDGWAIAGQKRRIVKSFQFNYVPGKCESGDVSISIGNSGYGYVSYFKATVKIGNTNPIYKTLISNTGLDGGTITPITVIFNNGWDRSPYTETNIQLTIDMDVVSNSNTNAVYPEMVNPFVNASQLVDNAASTADLTFKNTSSTGNVPGSVDNTKTPVKSSNDVRQLSTSPRDVSVSSESSLYTQPFTDIFDLLDAKSGITWDDLKGCELKCIMLSDADDADIYITWAELIVEFRQPEYKPTDEITCIATGTVGTRPDEVIQYLLHNIAGVPLTSFGSVWRNVRSWDDLEEWDDTETWYDGGELTGIPDGAYFEEAASWFAGNDYAIAGVISGDSSVKDAIKNITWQTRSRLLWQNSKVQLVIKRESDNWIIADEIKLDDVKAVSYKAKRSRVDQIQNHIDLFYTLDRLSLAQGAGKYDSSISVKDSDSIKKHGEKKDDSMWLFDLVRNAAVAESVSDYYLWELGETSTYYEFNAYLTKFHIEKDDYIKLNSYRFDQLLGVPAVVRECVRKFGSGKIGQINQLQMLAQVIRFKVFLARANDIVNVSDTLLIVKGLDISYDDAVMAMDQLIINVAREVLEDITVGDSLSILALFKSAIDEDIAVSDVLTSHMDVTFEENITVSDAYDIRDKVCLGGCGFGSPNGEIPFGSPTIINEFELESSVVNDILTILWETGKQDAVTTEEEFYISDGFGCPKLGDGFGITPFGDEFC